MDRLFCLERTTSGLNAVVVRRPNAIVPPGPKTDWNGWLELVAIPLDTYSGRSGQRTLPYSWDELSRIEKGSAEALAHLLKLLIETIAVPCRLDQPSPRLTLPIVPAKPTAAHPRAYRGTKWRPPKGSSSTEHDLRSHLCDERHASALISELRPYAETAANLLVAAGFQAERVKRVIDGLKRSSPCNPWLLYHFNHPNLRSMRLTPEWYQLASHIREDELRRLLALRGRLQIEQSEALRAACAWIVMDPNGLDWLELIASLPNEQQAAFASIAAWNSSSTLNPAMVDLEFTSILAETPQPRYLHCADTYLSGLANGLSSDYLLAGLRLAQAYNPDHSFLLAPKSSSVPEKLLDSIAAHVIGECDYVGHIIMALWRELGILPPVLLS